MEPPWFWCRVPAKLSRCKFRNYFRRRSASQTYAGASWRANRIHSIFLNSESDRMVAVQTYTGMLATLLLLAGAVLEEPLSKWREAFDDAAQALSGATEEAIAASEQWSEFLADAKVVYLLGRGPSLASVREGALLLNEASRTPSVAMSAAQFRHGPVEVVDERFAESFSRLRNLRAKST